MSLLKFNELILPLGIVSCLLVFLVPLPTPLMDFLLAANIAIGLIVLLTTIYIRTPLEFSAFPTILLATTLARLVLNVATTRLILTKADSTAGLSAAGNVIREFGEFVSGDRVVVGLVIFAIIFVIQMMVITKGATRISEVAARFSLDGIPGRQMAIDADLSAGVIDQRQAHQRRDELGRQADFYGAMDGASKFVRGDAVAAVIITLINIVGGLFVGVIQGGMDVVRAADTYTRLTIGDGLVSQIPALLISLAAGIIVTRGSTSDNLPSTVIRQLFTRPQVLSIAGVFLILLVFTDLPSLPLLLLGGGVIGLALANRTQGATTAVPAPSAAAKPPRRRPESVARIEDFLQVDPVEIELGKALLSLASRDRGGDLLQRVTQLRQQIAAEMGIVMPSVRVRDNLQLDEHGYVIRLSGDVVAKSQLPSEGAMVVPPSGAKSRALPGAAPLAHPALGPTGKLVPWELVPDARSIGCRVIPSSQAIAAHLRIVVQELADELLTRDAAQRLIDEVRKASPTVVEELIPNVLSLGQVQGVMRGLLREGIPLRPLALILEALGDYASQTQSIDELTELVRRRLARTISARFGDQQGRLHVVTLDPRLERQLRDSNSGANAALSQPETTTFHTMLRSAIQLLTSEERPPILLTTSDLRCAVLELARAAVPEVVVLGKDEVSASSSVRSVGIVGLS